MFCTLCVSNAQAHRTQLIMQDSSQRRDVVSQRQRRIQLPDEIIVMKNPDKKFHEKWSAGRKLLDIPAPFRCLIAGKPNCGKSAIITNLIIHRKKMFKYVCVVHAAPETTKEYDELEPDLMTNFVPTVEAIESWGIDPTDEKATTSKDVSKLIIVDDLLLDQLPRDQLRNLIQIYSYVSTHCNCSVISTLKSLFGVNPLITKMCNLYIVFRDNSQRYLDAASEGMDLEPGVLKQFFNQNQDDEHVSFWCDYTKNSPAKYRKNGTRRLQIIDKPQLFSKSAGPVQMFA